LLRTHGEEECPWQHGRLQCMIAVGWLAFLRASLLAPGCPRANAAAGTTSEIAMSNRLHIGICLGMDVVDGADE
jgi:hypothetical protein